MDSRWPLQITSFANTTSTSPPLLALCNGTTTLSVDFDSAVNTTETIANQPGQEVWPIGVEQVFEFENRQFMRKEQSDFGWDWGPGFAPAGIWQPAYVIEIPQNGIHIRNTLLDIYRVGQLNNLPPDQSAPWVVKASLDVLGEIPPSSEMEIQIMDMKGTTVASGSLQNVTITDSTITGSIIIEAKAVQLWWPVGFGAQNLYNIKINAIYENRTIASVTKEVVSGQSF